MARFDQLLRDAARRVDPVDAALLLAHAAGRLRSWLYAHGDEEAGGDVAAHYSGRVQRRVAGEPVAYLTGRRGFRPLELRVTPAPLVPRPETERLEERS